MWLSGWASWQLGFLAIMAGQIETALDHFSQAVMAASELDDVQMTAFISQARQFVQSQIESQQLAEQHQQAYHQARQAQKDASNRLQMLLARKTQHLPCPRG